MFRKHVFRKPVSHACSAPPQGTDAPLISRAKEARQHFDFRREIASTTSQIAIVTSATPNGIMK